MKISTKKKIVLTALTLACIPAALRIVSAQAAPADAKTVTLSVTVRDKHDKVVRNLTRDDFTLEEDGRPQTIRYFLQPADMPLTIGLLVDTSPGLAGVLSDEQRTSRSFLDDMLVSARDQAFLIHFDREVELLQDVTSSREKVEAATEQLHTANAVNEDASSGDQGQGPGRARAGRRRLLYDSLFLASDELTSKLQGRKILIVMSDGVDRGSHTSLESALTAAQRSDTIIYSILFRDEQRQERGGEQQRRGGGGGGRPGVGWPGGGWPGGGGGRGGRPGGGGRGGQRPDDQPRADGKKTLERISKETGGRFFEVSKKDPLEKIFPEVAEELRAQYSLGYVPSREGSGLGYHHIKLEAKNKGLTVQTREGYYAEREK